MDAWKAALERAMDITYGPLEREFPGEWCLVGSAATALQGIDMVPRDLDILTKGPGAVFRFAELMAGFAPETNPHPGGMENWLSSAREPVKVDEPNPEDFMWHFGRWMVKGVKMEVAHILPPAKMRLDDGIWEAGPRIWPHIKRVKFLDRELPVVPLEIQLQTNMSRKLECRVEKILKRFCAKGYDRTLLGNALSCANKESLYKLEPRIHCC